MSTSDAGPSEEASSDLSTPQLQVLLELQEADLALDRLAYRRRELAERVAVSELGARLAELTARVAEATEQRDKLASQQLTLDQRSEAVGGRIAAIEQRLRSGRAGSYRDEQAMGEEVSSLSHLRREIEDQELEVMEALEPLDEELAGLRAGTAEAAEELALAREQLGMATAEIDEEAASIRTTREALAARVAPELAASYERLRAKLGGIGAAHLVGGACSGCHLQLPASELHRLRHSTPDSVVYCDQCGRILVMTSGQAS
ncbi:MAG: C4-type zinc ribbon domain-containing protein [Acidimicrobiales bacterium]|jgi:predicted  nucleic acid-binding Zn-ribbon protein